MLLLGASMSASAADNVAAAPAKAPAQTSAQTAARTSAQSPAKKQAAEALDAEFLEYLSSFEGEQEDWTWFTDDADRSAKDGKQTQSAAKPAADK